MPRPLPSRALRPRPLLAAAALLPLLLVAGCSSRASAGSATTSTGTTVPLVEAGHLTICTNLPYAPFELAQGDTYVGFDLGLLDLVAKDLRVTPKVLDVPFETIKTGAALNARQCDVGAAGLSITPERKANLAFSSPYYDADQALVTRTGSAPVASLDAAKGVRLGSQSATTGEDAVKAKGLDPVSFETADAELNALRAKQVDVVVQDLPVAEQWLKEKGGSAFTVSSVVKTGEQYGFALRRTGSQELLRRVDAVLAKARADGSYDALYRTWFGRDAA